MQLQQRQTINLVMTADLRQAIALLQYSTYELYQFINEQELDNPLIELVDREDNHMSYRGKSSQVAKTNDSIEDPLNFIAADEKCMSQHLIEQLQWLDISEREQRTIHYLILNLDKNGYLPLSTPEIATQLELGEDEVLRGIKVLQQLDPIGVGARDLKECLLLQIHYYCPEEDTAIRIINGYLDQLANKKWHDIANVLEVSLSKIKEAYDLILSLDPKPCAILSSETVEYLNPDIIVKKLDGKFEVSLNDGYLPEIRYNNKYSDRLHKKMDASKYADDKYKSYQWLISSLEQRRNTILKITHAVLQKQQDFFLNGFSSLKPLTLKEIAEEIEMHESTVSRATMNKVIQTPKGAFDFRLFFTSKLNTVDGKSMSQTKVKILLENYIKKEDKYKPFSDQKIADYLNTKKGITISRRTVAKYRGELKIPSSSKRKEIQL